MTSRLCAWGRRLVREPLLHFFVAGGLIFGLYAAAPDGGEDVADTRTITVTAGELSWMTETWQKRWMRPPTPEERAGLIRQYVRETVLSREAIAMGLDKDDTIIRRRLAQKLEFLSQDLIRPQPPADDELRAYFAASAERYRPPTVSTFTHVFFDADKRGDRTLDDAEAAKAVLEALGDPAQDSRAYGDAFLLQSYYPERTDAEIAKLFGAGFTESLAGLAPQQWHGPVLSGYGTHLVYVHQRLEADPPTFAEAREQVLENWLAEKQTELNEQFIENLIARYTVIVEDGASTEETAALSEGAR